MVKKKVAKKKTTKKKKAKGGAMVKAGTALTPYQAERKEAWERMSPELRKVAKAIEEKLTHLRDTAVLTFYEIGELVFKAVGTRGKYGTGAMELLQAYLPATKAIGTLRYARLFVNTYSRKEVAAATRAAEKNGHEFNQTHWIVIVQRAGSRKAKLRRQGVEMVIEHGYSAAELQKQLEYLEGRNTRNAPQGRKPSPPKTPLAGLFQMSRYHRDVGGRIDLWTEHVFEPLATMPGEEIEEKLVAQVETTKSDLLDTARACNELAGKCDETLSKMKKAKEGTKPPEAKKPDRMERPAAKKKGAKKKKSAKKKREAARATAKKAAASAKNKKPSKKTKKERPAPA